MKKNRYIYMVIIAIFLVIAPDVFSQEKIKGAFGLNLGAVFDPDAAIGKSSLTDGTPMYQFNPKIKFRSFTEYYVMITPKTHKIYSIWGIGNVENTGVGKREQAVLMNILQKKYGKPAKEGLFASLVDAKQIVQGNRYIIVKVSGFTDTQIDIRYYDKKLNQLAEKERIKLEVNKIDDSGL